MTNGVVKKKKTSLNFVLLFSLVLCINVSNEILINLLVEKFMSTGGSFVFLLGPQSRRERMGKRIKATRRRRVRTPVSKGVYNNPIGHVICDVICQTWRLDGGVLVLTEVV